MRKFRPLLALLIVIATLWIWQGGGAARPDIPAAPSPSLATSVDPSALPRFLPPEAVDTLALIASDGPYPHRQDGATFGNRERRLPARPHGYYREYTVATPGLGHRGPRRIVAGGQPPADYWYTDDHYQSFRRFEVAP